MPKIKTGKVQDGVVKRLMHKLSKIAEDERTPVGIAYNATLNLLYLSGRLAGDKEFTSIFAAQVLSRLITKANSTKTASNVAGMDETNSDAQYIIEARALKTIQEAFTVMKHDISEEEKDASTVQSE